MRRIAKNDDQGQAQSDVGVNSAARQALSVSQEWQVPIFPFHLIRRKGGKVDKVPHIKDWTIEASADPAVIAQWWGRWPGAYIGVPTGPGSGLMLLDVDPKGRQWHQRYRDRLGNTWRYTTPRGGWHYLYRYPKGVRNTTSQVAEGVDTRGDGGFVALWGAHGSPVLGELQDCPRWLLKKLRKRHVRKLNGRISGEEVDRNWEAERPRVYQTLCQLDPDCDYKQWCDVGMAISWVTGGSKEGEDLFVRWSRGDFWSSPSVKYFQVTEIEVRIKFRTFKNQKEVNITIATLYNMLKEDGKPVPAGRPVNGHDKEAQVIVVRADEVDEKPVDWLWKGYLARNKFHLLTGSGGVMKSTLTMALAATITQGGEWPDGTQCPRSNVLVWSGEDDLADTVKPRFRFAGGAPKRCYFIKGVKEKGHKRRDFDPALDMEALERTCANIGNVALIIIDPIVSVIQKDNNSASDVRRSLAPLISLGMRYNAVILGLQHFTKGSKGRDPTERVLGSGAWTQAARIVLAAAAVDEGDGKVSQRMVFACTKTFHKVAGGFEYTYEEEPRTEIARVVWGRKLEGTAHSIFREAEGDIDGGSKLGVAKRWLLDFLKGGARANLLIGKQADLQGIRGITLRRAKESLKIRSIWKGRERFWELPDVPE